VHLATGLKKAWPNPFWDLAIGLKEERYLRNLLLPRPADQLPEQLPAQQTCSYKQSGTQEDPGAGFSNMG
jgi:hypothetical protein